jgi:hypothetical protein
MGERPSSFGRKGIFARPTDVRADAYFVLLSFDSSLTVALSL